MAQVYYPKKTSTRYVEGVSAGLVGGVVTAIIGTLGDLIIPDRSWWTSLSVVGGIFTGATNFNTGTTNWGSFLNLLTSRRLNMIVLLVADLIAGAAMAWLLVWLDGNVKRRT